MQDGYRRRDAERRRLQWGDLHGLSDRQQECSRREQARARTAASIKDVAREAGVSIGTVSNVLNRPDIVSPERRDRVLEAIRALGYVRNDAARQLKLGRSSTVGAIVLDMGNPFYAQLVGGIEAAAEASSLAVISGSTGNREQREQLYLSLFEEQRVRGILLASTGASEELIEQIRERGTPVVLVERERASTGGSSVSVDDFAGGETARRRASPCSPAAPRGRASSPDPAPSGPMRCSA